MADQYIISQYAAAQRYLEARLSGRPAARPADLSPEIADHIDAAVDKGVMPGEGQPAQKPDDSFLSVVQRNPRGWMNAPPESPFSGEMRSANTPMGDAIAQATGSPLAGRIGSGAEGLARGVVDTAYRATGVPMAAEGGTNLARAIEEKDLMRGVGGAAEIGLSALPFVGPAARLAYATAPRAVATTFGYGAAPLAASGALSSSSARAEDSQAPAQGDALAKLYTQRASLDQQRATAVAERDAELKGKGGRKAGRGSAYEAKEQEISRLTNEMAGLDRLIGEEQKRNSPEFQLQMQKDREAADAERKAKEAATPFREKYPGATSMLQNMGVALSAGLPFAMRAAGRMGSYTPGSTAGRLESAMGELRTARGAGNVQEAALRARELQNMVESQPGSAGRISKEVGKAGAAAGAGGLLTAEASMYPDQYDYFNLPEGPAKERAGKNALDVMRYLERGGMGALTGLSGYEAAGLLPKRTPNFDRAKAEAGILSKDHAADVEMVARNLSDRNYLAEAAGTRDFVIVQRGKDGRFISAQKKNSSPKGGD